MVSVLCWELANGAEPTSRMGVGRGVARAVRAVIKKRRITAGSSEA
jgi:hypothetical protein